MSTHQGDRLIDEAFMRLGIPTSTLKDLSPEHAELLILRLADQLAAMTKRAEAAEEARDKARKIIRKVQRALPYEPPSNDNWSGLPETMRGR